MKKKLPWIRVKTKPHYVITNDRRKPKEIREKKKKKKKIVWLDWDKIDAGHLPCLVRFE